MSPQYMVAWIRLRRDSFLNHTTLYSCTIFYTLKHQFESAALDISYSSEMVIPCLNLSSYHGYHNFRLCNGLTHYVGSRQLWRLSLGLLLRLIIPGTLEICVLLYSIVFLVLYLSVAIFMSIVAADLHFWLDLLMSVLEKESARDFPALFCVSGGFLMH